MTERDNPSGAIGRLHHVSVQAIDWQATLSFYGEVLGLPRTSHVRLASGKELVLFGSMNQTRVEVVSPPANGAPANSDVPKPAIAHFAFEVENVAEILERVRSRGFPVLVEPTDVDTEGLHATIAFFEGPNGESIELIKDHADGPSND